MVELASGEHPCIWSWSAPQNALSADQLAFMALSGCERKQVEPDLTLSILGHLLGTAGQMWHSSSIAR